MLFWSAPTTSVANVSLSREEVSNTRDASVPLLQRNAFLFSLHLNCLAADARNSRKLSAEAAQAQAVFNAVQMLSQHAKNNAEQTNLARTRRKESASPHQNAIAKRSQLILALFQKILKLATIPNSMHATRDVSQQPVAIQLTAKMLATRDVLQQ
jgi:hypothetical protein